MVQRKVPNKLGIQADHVKSEKRLGNLRPSSPHHQDGKNRGVDLKKKMKKSRSIKRSDFESLRSPAFRREVPQPGKPPPLDVPASAATPQKQSPIKGSDASPNYMKSTSSFDARKERSQVSSRSYQTSIDSKSPKKIANNSKLSSGSANKAAKTLTRTSSLKVVRTLTKSPSFKPARASAKKCSQVVVCENLNEQRATCSSTLKDSKFPTYLALSPAATESEGTSVMKVCPYTYCSLNGHHRTPLPPLKCFLSARRRTLKTQKSMKLGCLSPRRAKPSGDVMKEITEQIALDMRPAIQEPDSNSPAITPLIQEEQIDFFIQIYVRGMEDAAETTGRSKQNGDDEDGTNFTANDFMPSVGGSTESAAEHDGGKVLESISDEAPHSEIDFEDNLDNSSEVTSTEMEVAEEVHSPSSTQEEETPGCLSNQSDLEVESPELDGRVSETSDMEWEEGQYPAPSLDHEVENSVQIKNEYDFESGSSFGDDNPSFHDEPIFMSDDIGSSYINEIPADEGLEEFFEEDSGNSGAGSCNCGSDSEDSYQNLGSDEPIQVFNNQNYLVCPTSDVLDESTIEERDGNAESDDFVATTITLAPIEEPIEEPREAREDENEVLEAENEKPRMNHQLGDETTESASNVKGKTHEDYSSNDNNADVYQSEAVREEAFVESLLPKTEDPETNQSLKQELPAADAGDGTEDKDQEDAAKSLIQIPTFDLLQGSSVADQDTSTENNEIQLGAMTKDGESHRPFVDESGPAEAQAYSSDKQSQTNNAVEEQNDSEKHCHEVQSFKISDAIDSEDQTHSRLNKVSVAETSNEDVNEMEVEYSTTSDPEERLPSSKNAASTQAKTAFIWGGSHSSQEEPKAPNNLRIIRCKRAAEELEKPRNFNPQEPNYLPIESDPEAEKVDLKHQMMEEKKNAEEWMIDYALQQAVTTLAPARKRKVALLVEAFEKVMPTPKYAPHQRNTSAAFAHARPIQACS